MLEVLSAVAESLRYLHGMGVVHGDVKLVRGRLRAVGPLGRLPDPPWRRP